MPLISQFYGILISMYKQDGGRHKVPHFHAYYGDFECVYGLHGELMAGELPIKQKKMVEAWAAIHEEELVAEWKSIMELGQHFKIDGLK